MLGKEGALFPSGQVPSSFPTIQLWIILSIIKVYT